MKGKGEIIKTIDDMLTITGERPRQDVQHFGD
jgi:hypothetical protein